jgi:Ca2+:H+ antiporter
MLAGGFRRERQKFDRSAAAASATLLALAALALLVPAVFHFVAEGAVAHATLTPEREVLIERSLSLEIAVVLFVSYLLSLWFTLKTHRHLYTGGAEEHEHRK